MSIKELIKILKNIKEEHGNIEIKIDVDELRDFDTKDFILYDIYEFPSWNKQMCIKTSKEEL